MASAEADIEPPKTSGKFGRRGIVAGFVLAALLGGAGFYGVWSGVVPGVPGATHPAQPVDVPAMPDIAFVPLNPIIVSLGAGSNARHLRFLAQLEVNRRNVADVTTLLPRVVDVLNSYLRAIEPAELEEPGALTRVRSQMLRRVQIVTGGERVRDLLIMEFVLN